MRLDFTYLNLTQLGYVSPFQTKWRPMLTFRHRYFLMENRTVVGHFDFAKTNEVFPIITSRNYITSLFQVRIYH